MNIISCFDGMAVGLVALKSLGIAPDKYYASEIDQHAIKIALKNHPEIIQIGDITGLNYFSKDADYNIKLLMGGSPCQGFSVIGKQLNFADPRSKLLFEYVRIKNEARPEYFLLENVWMKQEWQDIISELLSVQPIEINSSLVSGQRRKRLYWTNIEGITMPEDENITIYDCLEFEGAHVVHNHFEYQEKGNKSMCIDANYFKGKDNHGQRSLIKNGDTVRKLTPIECERLQTLPDNYTAGVSDTQRYKMLGNGWTMKVIAHILSFMK